MQGLNHDSNYVTVARAFKSMHTVSGTHLVFSDISSNSYLFCMGYIYKKDSGFVKFSGIVGTTACFLVACGRIYYEMFMCDKGDNSF